MNGSISDEQVHRWLEGIVQSAWVSLHYDSPALSGADKAEISGGGYTRVQAIFTMPSNRTIWCESDVTFSGLLQNRITHFAVWDSQNEGMMIAYGALPEPVTVLNGWGYTLYSGDLVISFA